MEQKPTRRRRIGVWTLIGILGALGSALALIPLLRGEFLFVKDFVTSIGTVELRGTYPGETWKHASRNDYRWLEDEWCFTNLGEYRSTFRFQNNRLEVRKVSSFPEKSVSDWVQVDAYISNRGVIRIDHHNKWSSTFIDPPTDDGAAFKSNSRHINDDGTVGSGKKFLALSCRRCELSSDGVWYSCDEN